MPFQPGLELAVEDDAATVVLDFEREYVGHVAVEFETENGTTLDMGYDERVTDEGIIPYYQSNPWINAADRFVVGAGKHRIDSYHERGGRYLQLTFRGQPGLVKVHRADIRMKTADQPVTGDFRCDDELFNWLWRTGVHTVKACTIDGWIDCPWRERGMYLGDSLVQAHITRKFTDDWRMDPWAIRLWARAQTEDGQMPNVAPSDQIPLGDYTLIWVIMLRNYWAVTGEVALVQEVWPTVSRLFESSVWKAGEEDLWEAHEGCKLFVDWGATRESKQGVNGALNAFRIRALECAAELAAAAGWPDKSRQFSANAGRVRTVFRKIFWDDRHQRFAACRINGVLSDTPALHVNTLALAYDLCAENQQDGVVDYLQRETGSNPACKEGHLELYFLTFLLQGLYRIGEAGLAEKVIRDHYNLLKEQGAWTIWETLRSGRYQHNSLCHGWSCGPLIFFSERVLGVREDVPGDPSRMLVAPESESLDEAHGIVPHPWGSIHVSWRVAGSQLLLAVEPPDGVEVRIQPTGRLAELELVLTHQEAVACATSSRDCPLIPAARSLARAAD